MALARAVKGGDHTPQVITWQDEDKNAVNLVGATITGKIRAGDGTVSSVTGGLVLTDAPNGIFTWTYSAADVGTAGRFQVQFTATYGDTTKDISFIGPWEVEDQLV